MIIKKRNRSGILCYWDDVLNASNMKSRKEKCEQIDLNSACSVRFPEEYSMMFHVVNEGGTGGAQYGADLKKYGRKKGVSDWITMVPSCGSHGLVLELKRSRKADSEIKPEQKTFLLNCQARGYISIVAYGYQAALEAIRDYFSNKIKHNS